MGTFRSGLLLAASLIAVAPAFAQVGDPITNPAPAGLSVEQPLAQPPVLPASVAPEADPNLAPSTLPTAVTPAPVTTTPPPTKPKPAAPQLPTARGTLSAINTNAYTVTLDVKGKPQVFKITSRTRIFSETKPAVFGDAKIGNKAVIEFRNAKDKSKEALTLRLGGAAAATANHAHTPAKTKKPSIKKKAAVKAKPATPAPAPATDTPIVPDATVPASDVTPLPSSPVPNP